MELQKLGTNDEGADRSAAAEDFADVLAVVQGQVAADNFHFLHTRPGSQKVGQSSQLHQRRNFQLYFRQAEY